jgi:hypothetical protein
MQVSQMVMTAVIAFAVVGPVRAQEVEAIPSDVESPEVIVHAAYAAIAREPGNDYDWDRFRTLFLDGALLIPNIQQTDGVFTPLTVQGFIDWVNSFTDLSSPDDRGFIEGEINRFEERYGDIAHVFSTYEKHLWGDEAVVGRGVNSFQMVQHDGRWWITAIIWDEPTGGEPIPAKYLPAD